MPRWRTLAPYFGALAPRLAASSGPAVYRKPLGSLQTVVHPALVNVIVCFYDFHLSGREAP
jgi:hypothetical protein